MFNACIWAKFILCLILFYIFRLSVLFLSFPFVCIYIAVASRGIFLVCTCFCDTAYVLLKLHCVSFCLIPHMICVDESNVISCLTVLFFIHMDDVSYILGTVE